MKFIQNRKYLLMSLFLSFIIIFVYSLLCGQKEMLGDAGDYWNLSKSFGNIPNFSFLNFTDTFRGYVFPFMLFIMRSIGFGNDHIGFLLVNSFVVAYTLTVLPAQLFHLKNGKRLYGGGVLITFIYLYFWKSFLLYSLSDLYAFLFFAICVLLSKKFASIGTVKLNKTLLVQFVIFGVLIYATYNIRTVYKIPLAIIFIIFIVKYHKMIRIYYKRYILLTLLAMIGFTLCAVPQGLINYKYNKTYSVSVITSKTFGVDLSLQQLYWGMYYERYETNAESFIGNPITYPTPAVRFVDKAGAVIYDKFKDEKMSYKNFIKMCLYSPIDTIGIYTRHVVNGMSILYRDSYIPNMNSDKFMVFVLNFIIIVLGIISIITNFRKYKNVFLLVIIVPAILAIPSAIETRYLMPIYLLLYYSIAYIVKPYQCKVFIQKNYKIAIPMIILGFALCCTVVSDVLKTPEFGIIKMSSIVTDKERTYENENG